MTPSKSNSQTARNNSRKSHLAAEFVQVTTGQHVRGMQLRMPYIPHLSHHHHVALWRCRLKLTQGLRRELPFAQEEICELRSF